MTGRIIPTGRRRGSGGGIATPPDVNHPAAVIQFSDLPDRSDMTNWNGAVASGNVYVGITNTDPEISLVSWYLNPANVGALGELIDPTTDPSFVRSDATVPYDFQGGTTAANPFNTTAQPNGACLIAIRVVYVDGFVSVFSATGTISNVAPGDPPGAPVLTTITAPANGQARMAWQVATNTPTSYDVQRAADAGFTTPTTVNTAGTGLNYLWTNLPAATYHMRVRGVNAFGNGAWSNSLTVAVTGGDNDYGEGNTDGVLTGAWITRVSCQSQVLNNANVVHPLTFDTTNSNRRVSLAGDGIDNRNKRSTLKNGPRNASSAWAAGRRPRGTTFDGPACQLYVTLGWGVSAKGAGRVSSLRHLADTWNGDTDAAWNEVVDSWIANRTDGYTDWAHRMWIRLGLELGPWFPDFPGIDPLLIGAIGNSTQYTAEINAAMNACNGTGPLGGDRFPIFKGAWDHVVGLVRARCAAAGVEAPVFIANFVDGAADPGDSGAGAPFAQWVPRVATDVEETPDVLGLDIYGRGADVRPTRIAGRPADDNPDNYDFTDLREVLDRVADLCLVVNRPISFPEWWSVRRRDPDAVPAGEAWNDNERAAFTRYMKNYMDTGCGGKGVPVHSHSPFIQSDNVAGTDTGNRQINNNQSYTYATDTLSPPHPAGTATTPAPLMRTVMYDLFDPDEVDPI